jgi:hypothetical protein
MINFEWDQNKAEENLRKHKVSFQEAKTVFYDDNARLIADPDHSQNEERFLLLGLSSQLRFLTVSHTYKKNDEIIRIISARRATKNESKYYTSRIKK